MLLNRELIQEAMLDICSQTSQCTIDVQLLISLGNTGIYLWVEASLCSGKGSSVKRNYVNRAAVKRVICEESYCMCEES